MTFTIARARDRFKARPGRFRPTDFHTGRFHTRRVTAGRLVGAWMSMMPTMGLALVILLATTLTLALPHSVQAQEQSTPQRFDPAEVKSIETIVREYLLANPEVIIDALNGFEEQQKQAQEEQKQQAIIDYREELRNDPNSPVLGNPEGDVVIVEFFDYRCPYCKAVLPKLLKALESDGNIRLVMKEWPILGKESVYAARAALAAMKQGKYEVFHTTLMTVPGKINEQVVDDVAKEIGLDVAQMKQDMDSEETTDMLRQNFKVADALGLGGTPAFLIGDTLVPGALDEETLDILISEAREGAS